MGVSSKLGNLGVVTTTVEQAVNWARTGAMWPLLFGLACCAIEYMSSQASSYDLSRFGMELNRATPRQADLLIVSGRLTRKMAPVMRQLYDQMAEPKWVISMGDCASCGGVYNTPRQADLLIVSGRLTRKMAPVMRQLYDQMAEPKWVISMGDCASCGGVYNNYAIVQGVDEIVPVDVYIAGCPPRPEQLLHGILTLHEKIKSERIADWA